MQIEWRQSHIFKKSYFVIGEWKLDSYSSFSHVPYVSADTETKMYYNKKLLTDDKAYELMKEYGQEWFRLNVTVKAWAYMLSDGVNFACFQCIEDFLQCLANMLVKRVFWYNARFDFVLFDYYFLTHGWTEAEDKISSMKRYGKLGDKTYSSLNGDFGQRYEMRIWKSYKNRKRMEKVHNWKMIDICNIYGGGLAKNLKDWNIADEDGEEVRKLKMDYAHATFERDLQYLINDTKGLHLLAQKIDETLIEISGYSLFKGDYITAGGLAKKCMLKYMFDNEDHKENVKLFHDCFPITIEEDEFFRSKHLYQGGKCFVNPYKNGLVNKKVYKYDVNSMYPSQMRSMLYPFGAGKHLKSVPKDNEGKVYIIGLKNIIGSLKENMSPVWYDTLTNEYKETIYEFEERYMWLDELEELETFWYDMTYTVTDIIEYEGVYSVGIQKYIDTFYKIKKESKGAIREGAKLFLNSAYGKMAQRIERMKTHYVLSSDGYVHLESTGTDIDENGMLSVVVGSRITALSRILLMYYIREICDYDPKHNFLYCDTDSVHALRPYKYTDPKKLGMMKSEGVYEYGIYIAPKTYLLYNNYEEESNEYEVHSKGVNTEVVKKEIECCKNLDEVRSKFTSGVKYKCLISLNVKGGKALVYTDKYLLQPSRDKSIKYDEIID